MGGIWSSPASRQSSQNKRASSPASSQSTQNKKARLLSPEEIERLQYYELCYQDIRLFLETNYQKAPRFYHEPDEGMSVEDISMEDRSSVDNLLGVYDLIYTCGWVTCRCNESYEVNRAIRGELSLYMTPMDNRIWGKIHYECTQPEDLTNIFERDFIFVQGDDKNLLEGKLHDDCGYSKKFYREDNEWIQSRPWSLDKISENCDCSWSPDEYDRGDLSVEERRKRLSQRKNLASSWMVNHLNLSQPGIVKKIYDFMGCNMDQILPVLHVKKDDFVLNVVWSRDGYEDEGWTDTVARRRPGNHQGPLLQYYRPIPPVDDNYLDIDGDSDSDGGSHSDSDEDSNEDSDEGSDEDRYQELFYQDFKFFMARNCYYEAPRFYHEPDEGMSVEDIRVENKNSVDSLLGVYDLIYTCGFNESFKVNRAIRGELSLYMTPMDNRIWGKIHYECTQPEDLSNVFERSFIFVQGDDKNLLEGKLHDDYGYSKS